ncbi:winged helix-turn-helix transcriptional regulator [Paenibacillus sp. GCM10027627]|uniref:winged helix-turn-helix transcriptional regulator n=1 Tax=unclassified Paenibacillus TaxID=185978 RepID=UPI00363CDABC
MSNTESLVIGATQQLSGRWTIPILLGLEASGGRFTPLQNQLGIAPTRLSENLKNLVERGIIHHLSPYERRHPLLPEYKLTDQGKLWREMAIAIQHAEAQLEYGALSAKAWSLPVLMTVGYEYGHFGDIRRMLDGVTPRMLSMRLDEFNQDGLIRKLMTEQPRPTFLYSLTGQTQKPIRSLAADLASLL